MLVGLVCEGRHETLPRTLPGTLADALGRIIAEKTGIAVDNQVLLTPDGRSISSKKKCSDYDLGPHAISIFVYNRKLLQDPQSRSEVVARLPPPIAQDVGADHAERQRAAALLDENLRFMERGAHSMLEDTKLQMAGVMTAALSLQSHLQKQREDHNKFAGMARSLLDNHSEFVARLPGLKRVLEQVRVDTRLLAPRATPATAAENDDDSGSPTPMGAETTPLADQMRLVRGQSRSGLITLEAFDKFVVVSQKERDVLERQLVRFEAELGPLEKRSARFTEVFNEFTDERRSRREALRQLVMAQREELKQLDLPTGLQLELTGAIERDNALREMCKGLARFKQQSLDEAIAAVNGVMNAQVDLRSVMSKHSVASRTAAIKPFSRTLKLAKRFEHLPLSLLSILKEIVRRQHFRSQYEQLVQSCSTTLRELRNREIERRAGFSQRNKATLPHWSVLEAFNDFPPTAIVAPRPFDTALPDVNPGTVARLVREMEAAAANTAYTQAIRRWEENCVTLQQDASTPNTALLIQSLAHAAADATHAGGTQGESASASGGGLFGGPMSHKESEASSALVDELQRQILVLHAECYLLRQAAHNRDARPPPLVIPGEARLGGQQGGTADDAGLGDEDEDDLPALEDLRSRCGALEVEVKALQQDLRERETERDSLELELAGRREGPGSIAASMLRTTSSSEVAFAEDTKGRSASRVKSVAVSNFKPGDHVMFLRAQRSKSVMFKALRDNGQPALVVTSEHCRELNVETGPDRFIAKLIELKPKTHNQTSFYECRVALANEEDTDSGPSRLSSSPPPSQGE